MFDEIADGTGSLVARTEIPVRLRQREVSVHQTRGKDEIPMDERHHMLPGTHRVRIAERNRPLRRHGANEVRHDPVSRPVATADDVAAPRIRNQHAVASFGERRAITGRDQFGAGLGCTVSDPSPPRK